MPDEEKYPQAHADVRALGDDPFADMESLEWLGIESPPEPEAPAPEPKTTAAPEPETATLPETAITPTLDLPNDEAERALREWLREETPPTKTLPTTDAQAQLLARLLAEQEKNRAK